MAATVLLAVLAAALCAVVLGPAGVAALAALLITLLSGLTLRGAGVRRAALLVLLLGMPIVLSVIEKVTGAALVGVWQVVPLALAPLGVPMFVRACRESRALAAFAALFAFFLAWAALSSALGRSRPPAALYQFASDLKPMLLVVLGFAVLHGDAVEGVLRRLTSWLWLPLLAFVVFEWAAPGTFFRLFAGGGFARASEDPTGLLPSRATGLFTHPSLLATTAAWFCVLAASLATQAHGAARAGALLLALVYFTLVIAAVQRQEVASLALALVLLWLLAVPAAIGRRLAASLLVAGAAAALFWFVHHENLLREFLSWGADPYRGIEHPRAQIMAGAWRVAAAHFPFGTGLGTFGGAGAAKFDHSLYLELGFGSYWWFGRQDFLLDTYWPNSLAETGPVGALALLLAYLMLLVHAMAGALRAPVGSAAQRHSGASAALLLYMLTLSTTSPAYQDPRLFLLPAVLVGIAWGAMRTPVDRAWGSRLADRADGRP